MDQLQDILKAAKKHHFWIITALATILGGVSYWLANGTIADNYASQKAKIEAQFNNVSTVRSAIPTHPNQESNDKLQKIIDQMELDVQAAWQKQWDRQAGFLKWPDELRKVQPSLVRDMEKVHPIERVLTFPEEPNSISAAEKRAFARYFDKQMPRLARIIGVEWKGDASAATGSSYGDAYGGDTGDEDEGDMYGAGYGGPGGNSPLPGADVGPVDVVTWPEASQSELLSTVKMWRGDKPSVYEMQYTQENMWILEGLLNIIKATNGDASANFQASVKEIEFIRIGRSAVGTAGEITGSSGGGGMYGSDMMGMGMESDDMDEMYGDDMYGGEGLDGDDMGGGGDTEANVRDPANNRYLGPDGVAVSGDDLRSKMSSDSPEDAFFAVAKRVPVRLRLVIDQTKLQQLIANCGNADLMCEVKQVRIGDTTPAGGKGGYGGAAGGRAGGEVGMNGASLDDYDGDEDDMGGYGGGMGGVEEIPTISPDEMWNITVEIYGIVTLYNPVSTDRLGLEKVTEDTVVEGSAGTEGAADAAPASDLPAGEGAAPAGAGETPAADPAAPAADPAAGDPSGDPATTPADDTVAASGT